MQLRSSLVTMFRKAEGICFTLKTSSYDFSLTIAHEELVKKTDSQKLITLSSPISHGLLYISHQPLPPSHHLTFSFSESLEIVFSWHFLVNQLSMKGSWWEKCFVFLITLMVKFWPFFGCMWTFIPQMWPIIYLQKTIIQSSNHSKCQTLLLSQADRPFLPLIRMFFVKNATVEKAFYIWINCYQNHS